MRARDYISSAGIAFVMQNRTAYLAHLRITAKQFDSLQMLWCDCNTPGEILHLNHCNQVSHYCSNPSEEESQSELSGTEDSRFSGLVTCQCDTSAMLSDNVNSLATDENTWE